MSRNSENKGFVCKQWSRTVVPVTNGSYRNHCPFCLYSKHVDIVPGERLSTCRGLMEPIGITWKSKKGLQILHRCLRCGVKRVNRIAESTKQPDDIGVIIALMRQNHAV